MTNGPGATERGVRAFNRRADQEKPWEEAGTAPSNGGNGPPFATDRLAEELVNGVVDHGGGESR
jgi:hypothetical protein